MHPAIQGLLIGIVLAAFLLLFEYLAAQRSAAARAKKMAKKQELNQDERARIASMTRFCLMLPVGVALIWWLISGWL
jgi:hypothetical protein